MATVDPTERDFVHRERVYFDNLTQLPLGKLALPASTGSSMVRTAGGY